MRLLFVLGNNAKYHELCYILLAHESWTIINFQTGAEGDVVHAKNKHILTFFSLNGFGSQTAKSGKSCPFFKSPSWMTISVVYLGSLISAFKLLFSCLSWLNEKKKENSNMFVGFRNFPIQKNKFDTLSCLDDIDWHCKSIKEERIWEDKPNNLFSKSWFI